MVFVIDKLKYDTEKMDLVSDKTKVKVDLIGFDLMLAQSINNDPDGKYQRNIQSNIYVSKKGRYLEIYSYYGKTYGKALDENAVRKKLMQYDLEKYEELFGKIEEA